MYRKFLADVSDISELLAPSVVKMPVSLKQQLGWFDPKRADGVSATYE
ncbi:MAG: hypothetical protein IPF59_14120 [Ignavibacteria bacterium]|nr:hypothetical protein [Ignavibacteria bacterium]